MTLIQHLLGLRTSLYCVGCTVHFLLCQKDLTILLSYVGISLINGPPCLLNLSLRFLKRSREIPRVHASDDLVGFDYVAFVGQHLGNAACVLSVDIDFVSFKSAIAESDASGQLRVNLLPPIIGRASATDENRKCKTHPERPSTRMRSFCEGSTPVPDLTGTNSRVPDDGGLWCSIAAGHAARDTLLSSSISRPGLIQLAPPSARQKIPCILAGKNSGLGLKGKYGCNYLDGAKRRHHSTIADAIDKRQ